MLSHPNGSDIHLRELGSSEEGWLEPFKNLFGIYVYSEDVKALAVEFADEIIEPAKKPEIKEWGMFEFSLNGPDGCLVRVGWPADGISIGKKKAGPTRSGGAVSSSPRDSCLEAMALLQRPRFLMTLFKFSQSNLC
ncbi:hypothetical protein SCUP234_00333 [Seiridium cupressi]